jgi:alkyl hydroperoxide reductase subunit AhpF
MKKIIVPFLCFILLFSISVYGTLELLGPLSKEEILENFPDWQVEVASYVPNQEVIEKLQAIPSEIKIEIFLGTWCSDTKRNVSAYFKIMDMVDNPLIMTTYIGIPEEDDSRKPFIEGKNIVKVPTFIVYIDNQEKGRIIEDPVKSVEEDLLDIINKQNPQIH